MDFSGQYLTYEEYQALGGTLAETPFNILEFEARRLIDVRTFNRIKSLNSEQIPREVKICEYNLINSINDYASSINKAASENKVNESIDGYSVGYITPNQISEIIQSKSVELDDVMTTYLTGVIINGEHAIYCGV